MENLIFDIKKYSVNDGPGIRITIFLKGCPLACHWCHNPESISPQQQRTYLVSKCICCMQCIESCASNALTFTINGIEINSALCNLCGNCAEVCPTQATEMLGKHYSVDKLMQIIENEVVFFDHSEGGVTFSGGEPLMHHRFLIDLLDACGKKGIHRAVDTSGFAKTEILLEVAKHTDLFLYDIKTMDTEKHKRYTGVGNELILSNLKILAETGADINIRIPLIKGVNTDDENIEKTAAFVAALAGKKKQINLLPYHNIAVRKYEKLGETYHHNGMAAPTPSDLDAIVTCFEKYNLKAIIGG